MSSSTRSILAVVLVLALAGTAYWAWQRFFLHQQEVATIHAACVAEFEAGKAKVKAGVQFGGAFRDFTEGFGRLVDEVGGGVAEATCGALRESCRLDFEGEVCAKARTRYLHP